MQPRKLFSEIRANYEKHGWRLKRVLLRPETRAEFDDKESEGIQIDEAPIDALWFSRPSHGSREAWELRRLAEVPYALFETFAATDSEEKRDEVRQEMEASMQNT